MTSSSNDRPPAAALAPSRSTPTESDGELVADFIETFCRHIKGERRGELIVLEAWQKQLLVDLFELGEDGYRRFTEALIGVARKNAKSTIGSGIGLYGLIADGEPGAQVFSCAGDKDQAKIVFGDARQMVELDPDLSAILKVYRDVIEHPASGSVYRALSAEAFTKEGLNPSLVIFDELHVQPNRELYDVMTQGSGTRRQPLLVAITTAGYDLDTICGEKYLYGKKIESGELVDPSFFFRWWEPADPKCDYRDPAVWAQANPALGTFLYLRDLEERSRKTPEHTFRRYRLNQWTAAADAWLPFGEWDACADPALELDPALPLHVAIDLSLRGDSTAVVCAQRQDLALGRRTVVRCRLWENPYDQNDPRHGEWKLNIVEVEDHLRELYGAFPVPACEIDGEIKPGPELCYDPHFFERSAQTLQGDGLAMVEYPQTDSRMIPASQGLYQLVIERNIAHDGDPGLARHVGNAVAHQKEGGWRLTKKAAKRKIDGVIATAIATLRAQSEPPKPHESVYETRGIRTL